MRCIAECQTFLWGGAGTPTTDDGAGTCSCDCEGEEGWSEFNILGEPSCVPIQAHVIFGAVGLAFAMASMCHAAYQLRRQVKFHAHQTTPCVSPIEECRRHLHIAVIAYDCLSLGYFSMVLVLGGEQLWKCTIFLAGLTQFIGAIGGVLTTRMWIYTNDPRLMQKTPEILAISGWLERPVGRYTSCGLYCTGPMIATGLAVAKRPYAAVVVATGFFILHVVVANMIILKCATSLLNTINKSLRRNTTQTTCISASAAEGKKQDGNDMNRLSAETRKEERKQNNLSAAKKKLTMALSICLVLAVQTVLLLLFALLSPYGQEASLLFLAIPMGMGPLFWWTVNIQLHAGRSNLRVKQGLYSSTSGGSNLLSRSGRVVPTHAPASP